MASRALTAAAALALPLLASAAPALAHEGNPDYRSVIESVTPRVPGVTFQVIEYDADIELFDQHGHEVTIFGYDGEPYARILRDGTVRLNRRSPAFYMNQERFGEMKMPAMADPKMPPEWQTVSHSGTFIWHDHRIHYMSSAVPAQVTDKGRKTKIFDFRIPIAIDARRGGVDGTLYWVGAPKVSKLPVILGGTALLLAAGAAVLVLRRRRDDEPTPPRPNEPAAHA
jgi:hypothetical protein